MKQSDIQVSKLYLTSVLLFMLILPVISIIIDAGYKSGISIFYIGKWFVFWAIGIRLLTAGLRQVIKPEFTAKDILHIESIESHIIVRELGFANICFGLAGVVSLYIPEWRTAAAFTGGLYMGIAGIQHIIKKPSTPNEMVAMVSDIFIFLVMAVYVGMMLF
jgi:hypothetical protein